MSSVSATESHPNLASERWSTLRRAFVSAVAASKGRTDGTASGQASKKFDGFKLFPREEEEHEGPLLRRGDVMATYRLPDGSWVRTREALSDGGRTPVTLEQLFCHRLHGVDNTGNVRVWPSEQVLLHALLAGPLACSLKGARVLELGAGKCGLAGLGVAVASEAAEVVITDGNPDAVENLQACVELNESKEGGFGATKVTARRLVWDRLDKDGARADLLASSSLAGFDLVIASDCLFFKDFHDDLRSTIANLLTSHGRAILVQPQRGGTVDLFLRCVSAAAVAANSTSATAPPPLPPPISLPPGEGSAEAGEAGTVDTTFRRDEPPLDARIVRRFDNRVWAMHLDYTGSVSCSGGGEADRGYSPDRHLPVLVELWCRERPRGQLAEEEGRDSSTAASDNNILWIPPWPESMPEATEGSTAAASTAGRGYGAGGGAREGIGGRGAGDVGQNAATEGAAAVEEAVNKEAGTERGKGGEKRELGNETRKEGKKEDTRFCPRRSCTRVDTANLRNSCVYPPPPPPPPPLSPYPGAGGYPAGGGPRDGGGHVPSAVPSSSALVATSTVSNRPDDRPDRRMHTVYRDLAERLIAKVLEGRNRRQQREGREGGRGQQLWVAVAGAPGSGKTTLAAEVCRLVQEVCRAVCVPMDGFHLYRRELDAMPNPEEAYRRRGAHWTFDGERFMREVAEAKKTGRGSFPGFDHAIGDPIENAWQVQPSHEVVMVEGNYLLLKGVDPWSEASRLFDEVWAIRCPPEFCGERVRRRHVETGLSDNEARARVQTNDLPNARLVQDSIPWGEVDVVIQSL